MSRQPMPHQQDALDWTTGRSAWGYLHEMRLGKTVTTIQAYRDIPSERNLVVTPLSVIDAWQEELAVEGHTSTLLLGSQDQRVRAYHESADRWFLINFEGTITPGQKTAGGKRRAIPSLVLQECGFDAVIIDESTRIKNPTSLWSQVLSSPGTFSNAHWRTILTGQVRPRDYVDVFQQLKFLHGEFMGCTNFYQWRDRYFQEVGYNWVPRRNVKLKIREALDESCHVRTRKQVGLSLPAVHQVRKLDLPVAVRHAYDLVEKEWMTATRISKHALTVRHWLSQICGGSPKEKSLAYCDHSSKLTQLKELMQNELEGQQVLVWFRYLKEGRKAEQALRKAGLRVRRVVGSVSRERRAEYVRKFRKGEIQVLLLQYQTMKYGLDMSSADTAIYYSLPDDPEDYFQSLDRIVHPKKKSSLLYIYLAIRNSIDEDKYKILRERKYEGKLFLENLYNKVKLRRSIAS